MSIGVLSSCFIGSVIGQGTYLPNGYVTMEEIPFGFPVCLESVGGVLQARKFKTTDDSSSFAGFCVNSAFNDSGNLLQKTNPESVAKGKTIFPLVNGTINLKMASPITKPVIDGNMVFNLSLGSSSIQSATVDTLVFVVDILFCSISDNIYPVTIKRFVEKKR